MAGLPDGQTDKQRVRSEDGKGVSTRIILQADRKKGRAATDGHGGKENRWQYQMITKKKKNK